MAASGHKLPRKGHIFGISLFPDAADGVAVGFAFRQLLYLYCNLIGVFFLDAERVVLSAGLNLHLR